MTATGDLDDAGIQPHVGKRLPARHDLVGRTREAVDVLVHSSFRYIGRFFEFLGRFVGCCWWDRYSAGWNEDMVNNCGIDTNVCQYGLVVVRNQDIGLYASVIIICTLLICDIRGKRFHVQHPVSVDSPGRWQFESPLRWL